MKILLVIDQFDQGNNGTTISARRFAQALAADGNEVRVAAAGKPARGKYPMPEIHFLPVADSIIRSQGMVFAKPNRSVLEQAIAWADVVHFMMPFALSRVGLRIAKEMCSRKTLHRRFILGKIKRPMSFCMNGSEMIFIMNLRISTARVRLSRGS